MGRRDMLCAPNWSENTVITVTTCGVSFCVRSGEKCGVYAHAYLESDLRLCLLFLEGFRGNELGMMGVGVRG